MEFKYGKSFSSAATDLCKKLLEKSVSLLTWYSNNLVQPNDRIGCGAKGAEEIKQHPFFEGIDWDKLYKRELKPPFVPETKSERDTANVDEEFLNEAPSETPLENIPLMQQHNKSDLFDNFSFVNEANLVNKSKT